MLKLKNICVFITNAYILLFLVSDTFAATAEPKQNQAILPNLTKVENLRNRLSSRVVGIAEDIDSYFSDKEISDIKNKSFLQLRQQTQFKKSGEINNEFKIRGKLHLPQTQERLNIFIESGFNRSEDMSSEILNNDIETQEDSFRALGVEWLRSRKWQISSRAGIRTRLPIDPYYKLDLRRTYPLGPRWQGTVKQTFWYYHELGWGEESRLYFQRYISETMRLRMISQAEFQDRNNYYELAQILALHQDVNPRTTVQYSIGILDNTDSDQEALNYFLSIDMRRKLVKDWLLLNLSPQITAPESLNYKVQPSLSLRIELLFK